MTQQKEQLVIRQKNKRSMYPPVAKMTVMYITATVGLDEACLSQPQEQVTSIPTAALFESHVQANDKGCH